MDLYFFDVTVCGTEVTAYVVDVLCFGFDLFLMVHGTEVTSYVSFCSFVAF